MGENDNRSPDSKEHPPDHKLSSAKIPLTDEAPLVRAVANLKAYVKPSLDEELSADSGSAVYLGTQKVCRCVPVEQCMCDCVYYYYESSIPGHCSCVGDPFCTCPRDQSDAAKHDRSCPKNHSSDGHDRSCFAASD